MSESTLYIHLCENSELCILSTFNSLPLWQLHQNESECELKYTAAAAERAGGLGLGLGIRRERVDRDQSSRLDRGDSQCGVRKNVFDYLFFKKKGTDSHSYLYTEVLGLSPILSNISEFNFYVFGDMDSLPGPTFLSPCVRNPNANVNARGWLELLTLYSLLCMSSLSLH